MGDKDEEGSRGAQHQSCGLDRKEREEASAPLEEAEEDGYCNTHRGAAAVAEK